MKIQVIGYYDKDNYGDEQYKKCFNYVIKRLNLKPTKIEFNNIDNINNIECDIAILGGGDVLQDYFVDKFNNLLKTKRSIITIALSVGIPYTDILTTNKLDIFDYIFVRNSIDYNLLINCYPTDKISNIYYIPDTSIFTFNNELLNPSLSPNKLKKPTIGLILLSKYANNDILLQNIIKMCKSFENYDKMFIPFQQCSEIYQDDLIIYKELCKYIPIILPDLKMDRSKIIAQCDIIISMRYHGCLYSLYNEVPFIPYNVSRKIKNLVYDIDYSKYTSDLEECIISKINELLKDSRNIKTNFRYIKRKLLSYQFPYIHFIKLNNTSIIDKKLHLIKKEISNNCPQELIPSIISYRLTNNTNSIYKYGIIEKLKNRTTDYIKEWKWIINDINKNNYYQPLVSNSLGYFNLSYINQEDLSEVHRSGWSYVYKNLIKLHNINKPILDIYLDRTFHWDYKINKYLKLIPYTKEWYGIIHHTFDTSFSEYNNVNLFKNQDFIKSLEYCKGLITLSETLKYKIEGALHFINKKVPVYSLIHPTELDVGKFSFDKFKNNPNIQLLHIGDWLRNNYLFYKLEIPPCIKFKELMKPTIKKSIKKVIIKNKYSNNYFPPQKILAYDKKNDNEQGKMISCGSTTNTWFNFFLKDYNKLINSVIVLDKLSNNKYDEVLTENIVFLNLIEPSAVNTVIECIIRCTPMIINRCSSIVELLGPDYPLYYDDNLSFFNINKIIIDILSNTNLIKKAHIHLKNIDKSIFSIEHFVDNLIHVVDS